MGFLGRAMNLGEFSFLPLQGFDLLLEGAGRIGNQRKPANCGLGGRQVLGNPVGILPRIAFGGNLSPALAIDFLMEVLNQFTLEV